MNYIFVALGGAIGDSIGYFGNVKAYGGLLCLDLIGQVMAKWMQWMIC